MTPAAEYQTRLADRQATAALHDGRHITLGNVRLLIAIAAAAAAWMSLVNHAFNPAWIFAPIAVFLPLIPIHGRVLRRRTLARRAILFYERGLARIEDRWSDWGEQGVRFQDPNHPYSGDLDIFGPTSLFQLLSQARTRGGEDTLAHWLQHPANADVIRRRQHSVNELRGYLDLRETLFTLGEDARDTVHSGHLIHWAESPITLHSRRLRLAAALLSAGMAGAVLTVLYTDFNGALAIMLSIVGAFGYWLRNRVLAVITRIDEAVQELGLLEATLAAIEKHPFESPHLVDLRQRLTASEPIAKLHRLAELIDSRDNPILRAFGPPLLYGTHLAFAVERWRARHGPSVRGWLDAVSEMEALLSLAGYAAEHPEDPFPEIVEEHIFEGHQMGHPLLPGCVRNSIRLDEAASLICISGSNMSGKSTFLRTTGINVVLAMAGAPVRAKRLRLCPLQVGAAIRVTDSLQGGTSRFYAELKRLRQIVDLTAKPFPVLFLLDELLSGTNSHDRRIGAEGIVRELLRRHTLGLITTHDLALTAIAKDNAHFEDTLVDGQLHFEFTLRPGVVQKSNALELMRSIGLNV